ncbi:transposable element Tc3 transposase [Ditylenchus destructor]|nr:transposable element Tc3 transposase [Ditylenchus destructor]
MTAFLSHCSPNLFFIMYLFIVVTDAQACNSNETITEEKQCEGLNNCCSQAISLSSGNPRNTADCYKYRLVKECIKNCDPEVWDKYDKILKGRGFRECITASSTQEPSTIATNSLADGNYTSTDITVESTTKRCPNGTSPRSFHDNASCHVSRAWCAENGIYPLPWPSCSPDINPAEHVFSYLACMVYKDSKQYGNRKELEKAISKAFREMPDEILRNHANRQHERVRELLEKQGRTIHYCYETILL